MVLEHQLSVGALVAFFLYLNRFFAPIQLLVQQYNSLQQGRSSVIRLRELLETAPSVDEAADASTWGPSRAASRFEHVSFGYDRGPPRPARRQPRDRPGRVGRLRRAHRRGQVDHGQARQPLLRPHVGSGAARRRRHPHGHAALAALAARRRAPGGVPLRGLDPHQPRPSAAPSVTDDEIDEAIDVVGLRELVDRLPDGIDTVVHERGQTLVGGRTPAARARPGLPRPTARADPRRGDVVARPAERDHHRTRARPPPRGTLGDPHRPPAHDRPARRPHRGHRPRRHRRGGYAARAARAGGAYARMYDAWLASGGRDATRRVGWGDFGCYGGGVAVGAPTPNVDRSAREGLLLTSCYSEPSCTPTRASHHDGPAADAPRPPHPAHVRHAGRA